MMLVNTETGKYLTLTLKYTAGRLRQTSTPRYLSLCPHFSGIVTTAITITLVGLLPDSERQNTISRKKKRKGEKRLQRKMPDLPTPQAYLEQSALLLQAYPDSVSYSEPIPY